MSLKPPVPQQSSAHADVNTNTDSDSDLNLTIRFSASLPDLLLSIPSSVNANTATLKQLIRSHIPKEYAKHRLRLIYAGKALVDDVALHVSLNRSVSRPPSRIGTPGPYDGSNGAAAGTGTRAGGLVGIGRGQQQQIGGRNKTDNGNGNVQPQPPQQRIYIHCSIGDIVLTPSELASEAAVAQTGASTSTEDNKTNTVFPAQQTTTTPAPRGFDRLLNAGFTAAEVQSLRLQFLAIQAHTHTPDTMPSPNTLRGMEDRWLDNSSAGGDGDGGGAGAGALGGGGGGALGAAAVGDDDAQAGALDDMIWGAAMGFFWPVGCLLWAVREEGIWTQRRKMAVVVGFMLNVGLGLIRYTG